MNHGCVIWLTGLPSSGKTTIALALASLLRNQGLPVEVLDGDEVRLSLSPDLGFSAGERRQHNRRVIYVSEFLPRNGHSVIGTFMSPYSESGTSSSSLPAKNAAREKESLTFLK